MEKEARVILPDDMPKESGAFSHTLGVLGGLGSIASIAYATAFLSDRAKRRGWEKRIEDQLSTSRKPVTANIPENTPIIVMQNDPMKSAGLLEKMAATRERIYAG